MKTAFAYWEKRIAPVFDTARQLHVVEAEAGQIVAETEEILADNLPVQKAITLTELGVGTLVCGAISRPLREMVAAYGIKVVSFVAGDLNDVIQAWLMGKLKRNDTFAMPGCCGRSWRRHREWGAINNEKCLMNGKRRGGMGQGSGQDQRRRQACGPELIDAVSACLCPKCGYSLPRQRGVSCTQVLCPKCGTAMRRS
jgi:predicted Fe-Mo cluster-binding NifX family protein